MGVEIRTLTRGICTLAVGALLAVGASAKPHNHHGRLSRRDNGRHLGWTRGRHVGWSHSNHYGVGRHSGIADTYRVRHGHDRGSILRRDDGDLGDVIGRGRRDSRGEHVVLGRGTDVGHGGGHGMGRGHGRP